MAVTDKGEEIGAPVIHLLKVMNQVPVDDSRQKSFTGHLNIYYDAVIACIRDAESILIFGPVWNASPVLV